MTGAYYNEIEPFAAQWLRNLILAGHIMGGDVDTRSITEVKPDDLRGFTQCHFFAGIAGWSVALRLAGWPDDRPIWTGSCPCQPFSAAGKQRGTEDERHLWPVFANLIRECNPPVVTGEQVASALGRQWLAFVRADLEALGYDVGAADLGAASVGAPHIRQRLWWVADALHAGRTERRASAGERQAAGSGGTVGLGDANAEGLEGRDAGAVGRQREAAERAGEAGIVGGAQSERRDGGEGSAGAPGRRSPQDASPWADLEWLPCRDGKARPVEPGTFPLAHGIPGRVGRLRAYGNALVPQVAAQFIGAFMECQP